MAIKTADQITILDLTDGFSLGMTSTGYTFIGDTQYALAGSCTTQITCYQGDDMVPVKVGTCTCPTGVTATVSNNETTAVTITIAVAAGKVSGSCEVSIPVTVGDGIQFTKKFSIGVAIKGSTGAKGDKGDQGDQGPQGEQGDTGAAGADAITMVITSSMGTVFKNGSISTTLTAHVYKAGKEITASTSPTLASLGTIKWYKDGGSTAVHTGQDYTITGEDVTNKATYTAQLEG